MIKISVIVPAYNVSLYVDKCLNSLVNQTLKDIEIIVINDCSTDNTKEILDKYKLKYKNISIINNTINKGIGYNRNLGIEKAKGKYVSFIDGDDYVEKDYLEKMYDFCEKNDLDICVCDIKKINDKDEFLSYDKDIKYFDISNLKDNPDLLLNINMGPTNKLFHNRLFNDKEARFDEILKYEDIALLPRLIMNSNKIGKINDVSYNYVIHKNSETTTMNEKVFDIIEVMKKVNGYLFKYDYYELVKNEVEYLNIRTLFRYTLQQKNQKDKLVAIKFIDDVFNYLNSEFPNWKKNKIWKKRSFLKRIIEGNKFLTKLYCMK